MSAKLKASAILVCAGAAVVACIAALFSYAQIIVTNDQRLLKADDERRERMIARACSPHGKLFREQGTGEYACVFTNPDGASLVQDIPNAPYLDTWEPPSGELLARR
ncbi:MULTISPECIES: hypothetical protein [Achromobacter]|uniref:hypothetical protein n=1 Tax=Achromobacter TaxID=222 RepID=UPI0011250D84|nr:MULTISPECIES: hypothetical protein [Achromobacter]